MTKSMNKERRKAIDLITDKLLEMQTELEEIKAEEEEAYDNLPEGIQASERGEEMQGYIEQMEEALNSLQDAYDYLIDLM